MARDQDFIGEVRQADRDIWSGINRMVALKAEWDAMDYSSALDPGTGTNEGITATEIGAVLGATLAALQTLLATGHATNMAKLL